MFDNAIVAYFIGMIGFIVTFGILGYVIASFLLMKIFAKAGIRDAWRAWVPVYNMMIFFKLGDLSPWLVLYGLGGSILLSWAGIGALFSLALFALSAISAYRIGAKLQKEPVWVVLYVLVGVVWLAIMAFDSSRWNNQVARAPWAGNSFLEDRTVWQDVPNQQLGGEAPEAPEAPQSPAY